MSGTHYETHYKKDIMGTILDSKEQKWLEKACSKDKLRFNISKPFHGMGISVATDGHRAHISGYFDDSAEPFPEDAPNLSMFWKDCTDITTDISLSPEAVESLIRILKVMTGYKSLVKPTPKDKVVAVTSVHEDYIFTETFDSECSSEICDGVYWDEECEPIHFNSKFLLDALIGVYSKGHPVSLVRYDGKPFVYITGVHGRMAILAPRISGFKSE